MSPFLLPLLLPLLLSLLLLVFVAAPFASCAEPGLGMEEVRQAVVALHYTRYLRIQRVMRAATIISFVRVINITRVIWVVRVISITRVITPWTTPHAESPLNTCVHICVYFMCVCVYVCIYVCEDHHVARLQLDLLAGRAGSARTTTGAHTLCGVIRLPVMRGCVGVIML
jgi:hypothetical protein